MRALQRKLVRDLGRMRGQVVTITLILAAGLAAYVCLAGAHRALATSRDAYYARHGFPDVFARLERAPDAVVEELRAVPGVAAVDARLVEPVSFRLPGLIRPPAGRAISFDAGERADAAAVVLRRGRLLEPGRGDEALVLETFADVHGLAPGDALDVVIDGQELEVRIAGLVLSPEWIFPAETGLEGEGAFGVMWLARETLAAATGKHGAFDDVTFRLVPGADRRAAIDAIDRVLARWGGRGAYGRERQGSDRVVRGEIAQLDAYAVQIPAVFLLVATFLLNVVLARIVHLQREQLAVLRALGYTRAALARHVLAFASVIAAGGAVLGIALGHWLAAQMIGLYGRFFHFPVLEASLDRDLVLVAVGVAAAAAGTGALTAAWRAVRLAPADAMRPPSPARYRRGVLSRLGVARAAGAMGRMVVRDLERRPLHALVSVLGVAFAFAVVVLGRFPSDSVEHLMDVVLARSLREDVAVTLARPATIGEVRWFAHAPGVLVAEPMRAVPVRLRFRARTCETAITAWRHDGTLRQVLDGDARVVALPRDGVMLGPVVARRLGARAGDVVVVERLDGDRATFTLPIAALVDDRMGLNAYMDLDALARALREPPRVSTVLLGIDEGARDRLLAALADVPGVVAVTETRSIREAYEGQSGETMRVWALIVALFGSVIAVGVVFNTARVALSERSRDLATLRVLGFTRREVASVLLGQLAVQVLLALPAGMVCGHLLATLLMRQTDPEQFRVPAIVTPASHAFAALVVLGAALATALVVRRRLDRLDIVSALKARD